MNGPTDFFKTEVDALREKNLDWKIRELGSASTPKAIVDGKEVIVLCSNNYLGLANHPRLKKAAISATRKYGAGSGSVRAIAGTMDLHNQLEDKIAKFKGTESALYYQTGFAANAGLIPQLVSEGDLVISDELNHGSIIDGIRLTKAERKVFPHKNVTELRKILEESKGKHRRTLIITDGVFSMDGDIAPLPGIVKLAKEFSAITYVDDAHGEGVLGEGGRGIVSHFKLDGQVDIEMGTFSKAFGVVGGFVAGNKHLREFALNRSRTWLLSGSAPPATVAACIAAIDLLQEKPHIVKKLWRNTRYYKRSLKKLGFDTGVSETPITPIMLGENKLAQDFAAELLQEGVFTIPIVYPMVAQGKARIRTMPTAGHSKDDLNEALAKIEKVGRKLNVI